MLKVIEKKWKDATRVAKGKIHGEYQKVYMMSSSPVEKLGVEEEDSKPKT